MRVAYADPPYLGCGKKHYGKHHPQAGEWDNPERHRQLILELGEYDAWAMSLSSPSLSTILPMCPEDCRVMAWVKPFAVYKPNVGVCYAWEPVIVSGGRKRTRKQLTVKDFVSANITLRKGLVGAKPPGFSRWLFEVLNLRPTDEFIDLFPGTGGVALEWEKFRNKDTVIQTGLFAKVHSTPDDESEEPTDDSPPLGPDPKSPSQSQPDK